MKIGDRVQFSDDFKKIIQPHDERHTNQGKVGFINHTTNRVHVEWSRYHTTIEDLNDLSPIPAPKDLS